VRDKVETVEIPVNLNIVATYPVAQLKEADDPELARDWINLVTSEKGQKVLEKWGFEPAA
jgi:molybdate transport system substrate-binding protein